MSAAPITTVITMASASTTPVGAIGSATIVVAQVELIRVEFRDAPGARTGRSGLAEADASQTRAAPAREGYGIERQRSRWGRAEPRGEVSAQRGSTANAEAPARARGIESVLRQRGGVHCKDRSMSALVLAAR